MVKCLECGIEKKDDKSFHLHLRTHRLRQCDYYHKHFPKYDLYTGEMIGFISKVDYFSKFFNKKGNFLKYISENSDERSKQLIADILDQRIEGKGVRFEMSDVELRSLHWPNKKQLEGLYDDLEELFYRLQPRYKVGFPEFREDREAKFFIDTREQKPYLFRGRDKEVTKLQFGDYTAIVNGEDPEVCIERKGLMDFIASFSPSQIGRLRDEFSRAEGAEKKMVVLVEKDLHRMLTFDRMPKIKKFVNITPPLVFHNVRRVMQEFKNVQFLFCKGKAEAESLAVRILTNSHVFDYDLQYLYSKRQI